jgi:colicin import membrane protein
VSANNFIVAIFKSFGLHIVVGVLLVASVSLKENDKPKPVVINVQPITAVSVDQDKLAAQVSKIRTDKANKKAREADRVKKLEDRAKAAERKRDKAENKIKDLNQKTRKSKADKRRADDATKIAKQKQKLETAKADKAAADAKKKLKEKDIADKGAAAAIARRIKEEKDAKDADVKRKAKAKLEKEEKVRKAREARERREQEMLLQQQMAEEQAARDKAHNKQVLGEYEKYSALITQKINQFAIKDASMKGKSCRVNIKLAFNGLVTSVKVLEGDPIVCNATEAAVYKVGKLPVSKDPAVFDKLKNIIINFIPDVN